MESGGFVARRCSFEGYWFLTFFFFFLDSLFFGKMDASCLYRPRGVNNNFIIIYYGSFRCRLE